MIELVVAMALVGILLSLAIPSFRESTLNSQRAARSNALITDLTYSRSQAITLRENVVVCRSSSSTSGTPTCLDGEGWEDGWIVFVDADQDGEYVEDADTGERILRAQDALISSVERSRDLSERFSIRGNGNVDDTIRFERGTGRPRGTSGTLAICDQRDFKSTDDAKDGRVIVISTTGRLQSFDTYDIGTGEHDSRLSNTNTKCPGI